MEVYFTVRKVTKFIGPKGGISKDGLKDDRMVKGNVVKVITIPGDLKGE
jgi:hypothetical protein